MCRQLNFPCCITLACLSLFLIQTFSINAQTWEHEDYSFRGMVSVNGNIAAYTLSSVNNNDIDLTKIKVLAFGTRKEVGDIARFDISNTNDVAVYLRFGDAILTSHHNAQNYVTLDTTDFIEVKPQGTTSTFRQGTCYQPGKNALSTDDQYNSPDLWKRRPNNFNPLHEIDRIFELSETIYAVVDHLTKTGSLYTPLHDDAMKERLSMALHAHKYVFSREKPVENPYIKADLTEIVEQDFKLKTGSHPKSLNPRLKSKYDADLNNLWSTIVTIGQRAISRVQQLPGHLEVENENLISCKLIDIEQIKRHDDDFWSSSAAARIRCQIAKNQGPQFFNLWINHDDQTTRVIHNLPLPCSGRKVEFEKGFRLPPAFRTQSQAIETVDAAYTVSSSPYTSTYLPDSFFQIKISPSIKYLSRGNKDLNSLDDMFPKGTKVGEVEDPDIDFEDFEQIDREMPNMDLDGKGNPPSKGFAGDENGCVPAAFSNSMMWMRDSHEVVKNTLDKHFKREPHGSKIDDKTLEELRLLDSAEMHHQIFEEAGRLMKREDRKGVWMQEFIRGKQNFMDKYKLPIKVKYQSTRVKADKICPEPDLYGHCAENQNKDTDETAPNGKVDMQWIIKEIKDDEDVELNLYCFKIDENGEFVRNDKGKIEPTIEHCVTVSGISTDGKKYHHIYLKDDGDQMNEGGTRFEEVQIIEEDDDAHPNMRGMLRIKDLSYAYEDEVCYIMQVVSESVDPSITFEKKPEDLDQEESSNYLDDYWRKSNLTEDILKQSNTFPWWAWTAGGGVLTGTAIYLLTKDDDATETIVNDDALTLNCMGTTSINVLDNDVGKELELIRIEVEGNGQVTFTKNGIITILMVTENLHIRYTVKNSEGEEHSGLLIVTVTPDIVIANDDSYELNQGSILVRNILDNDVGNGLRLKSHGLPQGGELNSDPNGLITFKTDSNFSGTTSFTYVLEGKCGGLDSAMVTITVIDTTCEINVDEDIKAELCNSANGSISLQVSPADNYEYEWSNGATTKDIVDLVSGEYSVTISKSDSDCLQKFAFEVDKEDFTDYISELSITPYSCISDGEITFTLSSPGSGPYHINITGPNGVHEEDTDESQIKFSDLIKVIPGSYTITVYDISLGNVCSETITVEVEDESPSLKLEDDYYILEAKDTITSNILTNDIGQMLSVIDHEQPMVGTVEILSNGEMSFYYTGTFSGEIEFDYIALDTCHRRDTATIFIEILKQACDFDYTILTTPTSCNQSDGTAQIEIIDPHHYTFEWSNGGTSLQTDRLGAGEYTVMVIDSNGCTVTKSFLIKNVPQKIADTTITEPADCNGFGKMTLVIDTSKYDTFDLHIIGPSQRSDTTLTGYMIHIHDWLKIDSGSYELLLKESGLPDSCCQRIDVHIGQDTADFDIIISTEDAFCGSATGMASARVTPIGNYTYLWSTGDVGRNIDGLVAGLYELTVTDEDSGCTKTQEFEIENDVASDFVMDQEVIPSLCNTPGDIVLTLSTPASGDMRITGSGPSSTINITVPPGQVRLSDFIVINPGRYDLNIWDESVGQTCTQRMTVNVQLEMEDIELDVISSQNPSSPSASDGSITCSISASPFSSPYQIFLNAALWGTTTSPTFTITNLGVGAYTIYVVSSKGCISNEVVVEFDLSPLTISLRHQFGWTPNNQRQITDTDILSFTEKLQTPNIGLEFNWQWMQNIEVRSGLQFNGRNSMFSLGGGMVQRHGDVTVKCGSLLNWTGIDDWHPSLYFNYEKSTYNWGTIFFSSSLFPSQKQPSLYLASGLNISLK